MIGPQDRAFAVALAGLARAAARLAEPSAVLRDFDIGDLPERGLERRTLIRNRFAILTLCPRSGFFVGRKSAKADVALGEAATLDLLAPRIIGGATALGSAVAPAHMDPPAPWIAWAAALWTAALNQNLLHPATAPAARAAKARVVAWLAQTTMGRRLEALHARAGARLLDRTPSGYVPTPGGERVLANVERMEAEALAVERAVTGEDARIAGDVRITTVDTFGARVLTPILADLVASQPELSIELITDTRALSPARREADIAIRLAAFEQHETVVRRVADMAFGRYAARSYLEAHGPPDLARRAVGRHVIALQADLALLPEARWLSALTGGAAVVLRSNSRDAHLQMAKLGVGLVCLPRYLGDPEPELERLDAPEPPVRGVWLGVHRDIRHTPRLRLVLDHVTEGLKRAAPRLAPDDEDQRARPTS